MAQDEAAAGMALELATNAGNGGVAPTSVAPTQDRITEESAADNDAGGDGGGGDDGDGDCDGDGDGEHHEHVASLAERESERRQSESMALLRHLITLALNNRSICYQALHMRRLANIGYTLSIDVDPLSLVGHFNRAHLSLSRGQCHNALRDIKAIQRYKNT